MISLTAEEHGILESILRDLQLLFEKVEMLPEEIDDLIDQLESEEAKSYLRFLKEAKPETALSDAFFAGRSVLKKYLFGNATPEAIVGDGFIDFKVRAPGEKIILVELKPLYEPKTKRVKAGRELRSLKYKQLNYKEHKKQILKYIREGGEYIILTNLKEWIFFSKSVTAAEFEPFASIRLMEFHKEFEVERNLWDYLTRLDQRSIREDLDKRFFESLKMWVSKLSELEFTVDEKKKNELVINLINKFIFIQTLDDYRVIEPRWIQETWNYNERRWGNKGKGQVLKEFFKDLDTWFYKYYDTELFRDEVLNYVTQEEQNLDLFHKNLRLVLGLEYWMSALGGFRGIIQYNFRYIDEDILGKAYETYLAKVRHEEGIYYTPKYITQYIVENTVGDILDKIIIKLEENIKKEDFEEVKVQLNKFISIRVLDPACGSGSFLIKAVRKIWEKYNEVAALLREAERKHNKWQGSFEKHKEIAEKVEKIHQIMDILGPRNDRELISRILVRHIHGNDLDRRAMEVAKVNLWLEAIKLSPANFRYDRLPRETSHILPDLEMNFGWGDSLVGMPEDLAMKYLTENHKNEIIELFKLRNQYFFNTTKIELIEGIEKIKNSLKKELNNEFKRYLDENQLPLRIIKKTIPFHWVLEFWYVFFNEEGMSRKEEQQGFDVIIGNPPYVENKKLDLVKKRYLQKCGKYKTAYKLFDYAVPFIERAFQLIKTGGLFGYIVTNKFTVTDYGIKIREILAKETKIEQILDVSYLPVFKGTAIYPIILTFVKLKPPSDNKIIIAPRVTSEKEIIDNRYEFIKTNQDVILRTPGYIFDISGNILLCEKIRSIGTLRLQEIADIGYRVLKFTGWSKLLEYVSHQRSHGPYIKFIGCGNIKPYFIDWDYELRLAGKTFRRTYITKPSEADENKWKILESKNKILVREVGIKLTAAFDEKGEYGNLTGIYMIYNINEQIEPRYLVALFNSAILDFYYRSLYGSTHMAGGYLNFHGSYLKKLPLLSPESGQQKNIVKLVKRIEFLEKYRYELFKIWKEWSIRLKNTEESLHSLLAKDKNLMRRGDFNKAWTSKISFYPEKPKQLSEMKKIIRESNSGAISIEWKKPIILIRGSKKGKAFLKEFRLNEEEYGKILAELKYFQGFRVFGDDEKPILTIYGLDEDNKEEIIFEMELNNRNLMLHLYCSLLQALQSRRKIKTLNQLFEKTQIPVISEQGSTVESTSNIIGKVHDEFNKRFKNEEVTGVEPDIVKIENELEEVKAQTDLYVFKLYTLTKDDMTAIFDFLRTPYSYKEKVYSILEKESQCFSEIHDSVK